MSGETTFERAVAAQDPDAIVAALAPDVVFRSPVVYRPYEGREAAGTVLRAVTRVFEEFEYVQRLQAPDGSVALIFRARVGEREIEGIDLLRFDDEGRVAELTVMVRPMSGINAVAAAMADELRRMGVPVPGGS
ncbi:MAG TPA: nuclear transport factor 2 family protein [Solirubrobacterales bacterium]|nr:nuclear transport factor 2 family protein [Solirubrobacterales bacterium]